MRYDPDALILFAAGFGTRMRPLTEQVPKPLITVAGKPLIDHAVDLATGAGIGTIVANAHYRAEQIVDHFAGSSVAVLKELPDILDTGGGLKAALPFLGQGEAVFTANTDAIWTGPNPFIALREAWDADVMDALLLLVDPRSAEGHSGSGDFILGADGRVTPGAGLIYTGAQIIKTGALADIPERVFSMWRLWEKQLRDNRVFGLAHKGGWCDVGRPASMAKAEALILRAGDV